MTERDDPQAGQNAESAESKALEQLRQDNETLRLENERLAQELQQARLRREKEEFDRRRQWSRWEKIGHRASITDLFQLVILGLVLLLVAFMTWTAYKRWQRLDDRPRAAAPTSEPGTLAAPDPSYVLEQAKAALDDADRANAMAGQVLSFLEAAGFLVALALGAAAIYGFRNARDTREEFQKVSEDARTISEEARAQAAKVEKVQPLLDKLPEYDRRINELPRLIQEQKAELEELVHVYTDLIQATEELRLKNYRQAYRAAKRVLDQDENNTEALYILGWLELQYIKGGSIERAREYLKKVLDLQPDSLAARAAYGVILRRQALRLPEPDRTDLLNQSEGKLLDALGEDFNLIDPQFESYWGPVGGLRRDRNQPGDIEGAIQAYEKACRVTPGSSYPRGNLAALRLQQAGDDPQKQELALNTFAETLQLARVELALAPNDYFLLMDIFMASLMLTRRDPSEQAVSEAFARLDEALALYEVTADMMGVSRRGLDHLIQYCPTGWDALKTHLVRARERLQAAIDAKHTTDDAAQPEGGQA